MTFFGKALQTFQRFIDEVLHELEFCFTYIDVILIPSSPKGDHHEHLEMLLQRLRQYGAINNPSNGTFKQAEVKFSGHIISIVEAHPFPEKIEVIRTLLRTEKVSLVVGYD